ncbi:sulfatase family protein [Maribacter flavus]|uniref:Sulfatase-like hydrolase/transferase n=1 Tax=Maribacter flavus TaxID=1658664 RepID=A0A5B2U0L6_9FLAO|nr:sulfatase-like hydrolase/transferase [Maribacter flavus]KAA2219898.1 sulfatase-like hydrolase/transferase [Maribacter flavus]
MIKIISFKVFGLYIKSNTVILNFVFGLLALFKFFDLEAQIERPNIVFIYTDDQASWTLNRSGNSNSYTPNIDRLANEGAYFENAFVSTPVCSPARASIMTSKYGSELGILDFIPQPGHKLYNEKNKIGLSPGTTTFAEVIQKSGYKTGLIGKWHLGDWTETKSKEFHPTNHGFDFFMGLTGGGTTSESPKLEKNGVVKTFEGYTTDILTNEAIDFVRRNQREPFLLCLNYRAPHSPWLPVAPEDWEPYSDKPIEVPNPNYPDLDLPKVQKKMKEYLASVTGVDRNVGRLLEILETLNLDKNTIVIFSSDHGYNMGHNGIEHKGNGYWITKTLPNGTPDIPSKYRPNLFDNSLKVPAIVKWPGKVQPGTIIYDNISSLDWFPTIIEMAGIKVPDNLTIRGKSLTPLLTSEPNIDWNNDIYAEYSMMNYAKADLRSYRTKEWKLVKDFNDPSRDELYHVSLDPEENINLINVQNEEEIYAIKELSGLILEKMKELNDSLLEKY